MALTQKERSHNSYMRRKLNGLCTRCGNPLDREGEYCTQCLEFRRVQAKEEREWRRKNHLCTKCGKNAVPSGECTCPECRANSALYRPKITQNQKDRYNERFRKQQNDLYQERLETGMCTRCGERKAADGRKKCYMCLAKDAKTHRDIRDKNGLNIRHDWLDNGLCYFCGAPVEDHAYKACNACREKHVASGRKNGGNNKLWKGDNKIVFNRF